MLISVLSNVRPGPADTEEGGEGRHTSFLSLSSTTPTVQCEAMAKVTDLHKVLKMLGHFWVRKRCY